MMTEAIYQTADQRWDAVCARDAGADGAFVFAVSTTGVYCRPQCAARRPLRTNVRFFDTRGAAESAGFRACKRCRPDGLSQADEALALVARACRTIEAAAEPPSLAELAAAVGKSPFYFQRVFKRIVGLSPREYAAAKRQEQLRAALPAHARVTDAIYDAGFGSSSRAYDIAPAALGMTPSAFRDRGRGEAVRYAALSTPYGWVGIAATQRGVAAIELGDDRETVCARIAKRFERADLVHDDTALRGALAAVLDYIERPAAGLALPLDVQGTAFARRVWRALSQIPPGQTATYGEIARAIGQPSAARAVAAACAANPAALAIPCHRVVPASGGTGGYRWGAQRKRALLAGESA